MTECWRCGRRTKHEPTCPENQASPATSTLPNHSLIRTRVISATAAEYRCACGFTGHATMATHLATAPALLKRAHTNWKMHETRAWMKQRSQARNAG